MVINVSEALDSDTAEIVTVTRGTSGSYVDGIYVDGTPSTFKTLCSVQQPTGNELQRLPEGQRNKDIRKFISKKPIYGVNDRDDLAADTVLYKGKQYEVTTPQDWDSYGHTTTLGVRVK